MIVQFSGQTVVARPHEAVGAALVDHVRETLLDDLDPRDWKVAELVSTGEGCCATLSNGAFLLRVEFTASAAGAATYVDVDARLSAGSDDPEAGILLPVARYFVESGAAEHYLHRWGEAFAADIEGPARVL